MSNPWCDALKIPVPSLASVKDHREANTYALLQVALLERGAPMTLAEVAARFAEAGVAPAADALASLQRCRPDRPPVYRDGDRYHLDPHDHDLDLWVFILGLRPARVARAMPAQPLPKGVIDTSAPLTRAELDEAWRDANLWSVSTQRLIVTVLEAHGRDMAPEEVVGFIAARTTWHKLQADTPSVVRRNSAVRVLADGRWSIGPDASDALIAMRKSVRQQLDTRRRYAGLRSTPEEARVASEAYERKRAAHAVELAKLRWALLYAYPSKNPKAVALLDVTERAIETFVGTELTNLATRLSDFDGIGALEVRALLRTLRIEPGERRLAELGPPQKSMTINRRGRTLKITAELLIQGSCGISKPFGDARQLDEYLALGQEGKLRRRLAASVKSLHALYQYGRTHGAVRIRWGFLDELLPAPWLHRDEPTLHALERTALAAGVPLEVVVASAPGWEEPWARARTATVHEEPGGYHTELTGEDGYVIDSRDVQRARLVAPLH
jgi:hypothetical protein